MNRAFSLLTVKSVDDDQRVIEGLATSPKVDRVGDVIEPMGVVFGKDLPLLLFHDHALPVGTVNFGKPTKAGVPFRATLPKVTEAGRVKDRVDEAWHSVKYGLIRAVSIGFRALNDAVERIDTGLRFIETELMELSLVPVPAQDEAVITSIKSMDAEGIAALKKLDIGAPATGQDDGDERPGASGTPAEVNPAPAQKRSKPQEGKMSKTIAERIASFQTARTEKSARMAAIMDEAGDETLDETQAEEYDSLEAEVKAIDVHLKRLNAQEAVAAATVKPVENVTTEAKGAEARAPSTVQVKAQPKSEPGIDFARLAKVKALAFLSQGEHRQTDIAKSLYGENSVVHRIVSKATVVAGSSLSGNWAEDLVGDETSVYADFAEYLRPMTIVGKFGNGGIPSLRRIPFRTPLIGQTGGGQAYWVGEGKPKPLTAFDFTRTTLDELKVATISVVTEELLRKSSPSADAILRDALAAAVAERVDIDFIDPAKAASSGVSPASITNGVTPITSTGNAADDIREDLRQLWGTFIAANNTPTTGVYVMSAMTALALSLLRNPLGQTEFPGLTLNGGTLDGIPVITSEYFAPVTAGGYVALVNAQDIYFADEGGVQVDVSREASLQMLDNPTNASADGTATSMVSMWQTNSVAFRAERILNWSKRRPSAVALLDGVNWGQPSA